MYILELKRMIMQDKVDLNSIMERRTADCVQFIEINFKTVLGEVLFELESVVIHTVV